MELRRRHGAAGESSPTTSGPRTVSISPGHLGVTLSNHSLGVRVDRAERPDAIYQAGLRVGDVIAEVDGIAVSKHGDACDLLGSNLDRPIVLHAGASPHHTVTFYTADAAAAMAEAGNPVSQIVGRAVHALGIRGTAIPPGNPTEGGNGHNALLQPALLIAAIVLLSLNLLLR